MVLIEKSEFTKQYNKKQKVRIYRKQAAPRKKRDLLFLGEKSERILQKIPDSSKK
jgi:hypothetical protein